MAERIDHVASAMEAIKKASSMLSAHDDTGATGMGSLAIASATLALAEQQRIANLIEVAGWVMQSSTEDYGRDLDTLQMGVAGEIWEGLGLSAKSPNRGNSGGAE